MAQDRSKARRFGFSLVEVIVIIVVAGLVGALLVSLLGTQLLKSSNPAAAAVEVASAEQAMENVVAYYNGQVNANISSALNDVVTKYTGNSTVAITDTSNWQSSGLRALTVTITVGQTKLTTLLTQQRTNVADNATSF